MMDKPVTEHAGAARPYQLWTQARSWCDYELDVEKAYEPTIRSLFPQDWSGENQELTTTVELIPEPDGPRGMWAIAVRTHGHPIGYLKDEDAPAWAGVIRRIVASGFIPTTSARIWAYEYDGWEQIEFHATARIALGKPNEALPLNEPPAVPYTMLPRSSIVQVTKEDEHTAALLKFVPEGGHGVLFVTLHECPSPGRAKPHVEVRINDERVGQLSPQMSQRFLPLVRYLGDRGLVTACWGDITGSPVAAEVRIDAVKANEAPAEVLDGPPITIPALMPELADPLRYDLTAMRSYLQPAVFEPSSPPIRPEPPDGSLVRFTRARRYNYIAVRRGNHWETSASTDLGSIDQIMSWPELAARVRTFDIATAWDWVTDARNDPRVRDYLAVVRFTIAGLYLAAINVCDDHDQAGRWYTTITDELAERLPIGSVARWPEITRYGEYIQVVTTWAQAL